MERKIVTTVTYQDEWYERQELYINDELVISCRDLSDTPEDAILARDMLTCDDMTSFAQRLILLKEEGYFIEYRHLYINKEENPEEYEDFDIKEFLKKPWELE